MFVYITTSQPTTTVQQEYSRVAVSCCIIVPSLSIIPLLLLVLKMTMTITIL
jgi:hypothetical protein